MKEPMTVLDVIQSVAYDAERHWNHRKYGKYHLEELTQFLATALAKAIESGAEL